MKRIELIEKVLADLYEEKGRGLTAQEISKILSLHRANVSSDLNVLTRQGKVKKSFGRPVKYEPVLNYIDICIEVEDIFEKVIGSSDSLFTTVQQAKAAVIYPPRGLHTLILGETGVGKTMFAELMCQYGKAMKRFPANAPFIIFNCADYAKNPQLLTGQIFGIKKGAYTGAAQDQEGLIEKADKGILFLDEVHRLPAEGQEMLFTFIDKNIFRRLGETEFRKAEALIIAATTVEPRSHLLDTFLRRIPVVINIPSLKDRSLQERYSLIQTFFREESARIGKKVYVSSNAIKNFLLYDCPNNIGQLKSDIQLSCARAFLEYISQRQGRVYIDIKVLPEGVKSGILRLKEYRDEIDGILDGGIYDFAFCTDSGAARPGKEDSQVISYNFNFYEFIEKKIAAFKKEGLNQEEITKIIGNEIEKNFVHYIGGVRDRLRNKGAERLIGKEMLDLAGEVVGLAIEKLARPHLRNITLVLALHLKATSERITQNKKIYNPQLNEIRKKYPHEFSAAVEMAKLIEERLLIELPIDEIGFLTMFIVSHDDQDEKQQLTGNVGILLLMHGNSTATSIAKVVNYLLSIDVVHPIDMPLTVDPTEIYETALQTAKEINMGQGVLVMADMGSLVNVGDIISKETGILTRTVEMVSTPMVLEAARKSMQGDDLAQVYNSAIDINPYLGRKMLNLPSFRTDRQAAVIVTACYTGEGSSVKIKSLLAKNLDLKEAKVEIVNVSFLNLQDFQKQLRMLNQVQSIIAVVSFINPEIPEIPFFNIDSVVSKDGLSKIQEIVDMKKTHVYISEVFASNLKIPNVNAAFFDVKSALENILREMDKEINGDVFAGLILHVGCMMENIMHSKPIPEFKDLKKFEDENRQTFSIVRKHLKTLEKIYQIQIPRNYLAYVVNSLINN